MIKYKWMILSSVVCLSLLNCQVAADIHSNMPDSRMLLPPQDDTFGAFVTGGFILEQVSMSGSQYAYTKNGNALGSTALPAAGRVLVPTFDLNWGFTGGIAYYFKNKNWSLNSRFDWLSAAGKGSDIAGSGTNVIPINIWRDQFISALSADLGVAGYGKSHFDVSYFNLNIDLDRALYIDKNFTLEPNMGVKLSFIYDKVTSTFTNDGSDVVLSAITELGSNTLKRVQDTRFWGVGPSMGLNSNWDIYCGLSLFFEGTTSILLGYSNAADDVSYSAFASSSTSSSTPNLPVFSPTFQTLLGLQYEKSFFHDSQKLMIRLGWDSSFFWNQWNHINTVSESTFNSSLDSFQLKEGDTFGLTGLLLNLTWNF